MNALFDLPPGAVQAPADIAPGLSPDRRRTVRQAETLAAGRHPLGLLAIHLPLGARPAWLRAATWKGGCGMTHTPQTGGPPQGWGPLKPRTGLADGAERETSSTTDQGKGPVELVSPPHVIGLDLSLTGTGLAASDVPETFRTGSLRDNIRLNWLRNTIVSRVGPTVAHPHKADLVVIEGPAYSNVPTAVVTPGSLKKYATGKGTATKADMRMALYQRANLDLDLRDDNQVDAWWLRAMGLDHLGHPPVPMPQAHRDALAKVTWPEVRRGA